MLPIQLDLRGHTVLVVGGGPVGKWKTATILKEGARVRLVDPNPAVGTPENPLVTRLVERYAPAHLSGVRLAFACATPDVNAAVAADARAAGVWVCDVIDPDRGDFHLPGIARRGGFTLTASTGGAAPALTKRIVAKLLSEYDDSFAEWVRVLGEVRELVRGTIPDAAVRRRLLDEFSDWPWLARLRELGADATAAEMRERVNREVG